MAIVTTATLPVTQSFNNTKEFEGAKRYFTLNYNALMKQQAALGLAFTSDGILTATAISRGTTVTFSTTANIVTIAGVPTAQAASANTAFTTALTITADCWGIIAFDSDGTTVTSTVVGPGATQAYANETLAVAAAPAKTANQARLGYLTIQTKAANSWIAGTDSLAGGATGNVAATTNYYPICSPWELTAQSTNAVALGSIGMTAKLIGNLAGTALSA